ncbi:endonuclease/exonuclease/phosphatase family protein [Micromonospora sp. NPDC049301]|uniref:endonuclease/exonuclease/phosphatase family protein n=1 Tax=Micromonospora sp. NPDC049301 TaxID=3155723 RepID=UPI00343F0CD9
MCLVAAATVPAASSVADSSVAGTLAARPAVVTVLRVLQMNLCNSGRAGCYTGRSVTEAATVISTQTPDLVTLNEICRDDVTTLERVFSRVHSGDTIVSAFKAAGDRPSRSVTQCRDGQPYGIGLLAHLEVPYTAYTVRSGIYPQQDVADPEERAWLCVDLLGELHACTTHLAATGVTVALAQCRHLLDTVVPAIRRSAGYAPTVLLGDLNLRRGGSPDVRSCAPPGYLRVDDGALQHVMATTDVTICCSRSIDMHGATDHPAVLATLTIEGRRPGWTTVTCGRATGPERTVPVSPAAPPCHRR